MKVQTVNISDNEHIFQIDGQRVAIGRRIPDSCQDLYNPLTEDDDGRLANFIFFEGRGENPTLESGGDGLDGLLRIALEHRLDVDTDYASVSDQISEIMRNAEKCGIMIVPVYKMEHGLVGYSSSAYSDKWDSGMVGVAWAKVSDYSENLVDPAKFYKDVSVLLENYGDWLNNGCWEAFVAKAEIDEDGVLISDPDELEAEDYAEVFYDTWKMDNYLNELVENEKVKQSSAQKM